MEEMKKLRIEDRESARVFGGGPTCLGSERKVKAK